MARRARSSARLPRRSSSRSTPAASTSSRLLDRPAVVLLDPLRLRAAVLSEPRRRRRAATGAASCDAKGILAAQLAAAERLRAAGERRVGLLFVVGEERGSDGAAVANTLPPGSRFLINGEPTDNRLALATRGVLRVRLTRARARRPFCGAGGRGLGDRQADRRAGPAASAALAVAIRSWARRSTTSA